MKLGRFQKVELRKCWPTEDRDFTPWLAKSENIEILSETIGIALEVKGVEQGVGPFRADILCVEADSFEADSKHYILIENQLEVTDHTHLGQLMTYAAGLDAVTLIWIASRFTEEHRAALDWLNRITDETFRFFGIEIEVYQIGDSLPAPRFNIVAKPNDWSKVVKRTTSNKITREADLVRRDYWGKLIEFAQNKKSLLKIKETQRSYTNAFKFGKTGFGLDFYLPARRKDLEIYLWIGGENFGEKFERLKKSCENRLALEVEEPVSWLRKSTGNWASIGLKREGDFTNKEDWENQFDWFVKNGERFAKFFLPEIGKL